MDRAVAGASSASASLLSLPDGLRLEAVISRRDNHVVARVRSLREASEATRQPGQATSILKCLLPPFEPGDREAFEQEFLLLNALRHPFWARPLRFGSLACGGRFLELLEAPGVTLQEYRETGWSVTNFEIARRLLSAVSALHHLGMAHLDLSPYQVLIDPPRPAAGDAGGALPAPGVVMFDLGLAAPFATPLPARGTPGSIAPEILRRSPRWDARADLYGIGTLLHRLFTGRPAFVGEDLREVISLQLSGFVPHVQAEGLPLPVSELIRDLLQPDPLARPEDALAVWRRLRQAAPSEFGRGAAARLTDGADLVFRGREEEVERFRGWLRKSGAQAPTQTAGGTTPPNLRCVARGEEGIGRRRLIDHLAAIAQVAGWSRKAAPASSRLPVLLGEDGRILRFEIEDAPSAPTSPVMRASLAQASSVLAGDPGAPLTDLRDGELHGPVDPRDGELHGPVDPRDGDLHGPVDLRDGDLHGPVDLRGGEAHGPAPAVPGTNELRLLLGPIEPPVLESAAAAHGVETPRLRRFLAEEALGSPGILLALLEALPFELDLALPQHPGLVEGHGLPALPLPARCLEWARRLAAELPPFARDLLCAMATGASPLDDMMLAEVAGITRQTLCRTLNPLIARGLVLQGPTGYALRSDLWGRAVTAATEDRRPAVGRKVFDALRARPDRTAASLARLAMGLHLWDEARPPAVAALASFVERQRWEEALTLVGDGAKGPRGFWASSPPALWSDLARCCFVLGVRGGAMLPPGFAASLGAAKEFEGARLLRAWNALALRKPELASELLATPTVPPGDAGGAEDSDRRPPSAGPGRETKGEERTRTLAHLRAWLEYRLLRLGSDTALALEKLEALEAAAAEPPQRLWAVAARTELLLAESRFEEAQARLLAARELLPSCLESETGIFWQLHGALAIHLGEMEEAAASLARAESIWREYGLHANRLITAGNLGGIAYQAGDLARAQAWNEDLLRAWVERERWDECVTAITNLSLILLDRGRLGEAVRYVRDGTGLAARSPALQNRLRIAAQEVHVLARVGLGRRAEETARRLLADPSAAASPVAPFLRLSLAEALEAQGRSREAREEFRGAVGMFRESGALDDAVDALVAWAMMESSSGEGDVLEIRRQIELEQRAASGLTHGMIKLLDAEIASRRADPDREQRLREAAETLAAQERWYYAWRPRWQLARLLAEAERYGEAAREYGLARNLLADLAETAPSDMIRVSFLSLPEPRRFLDELEAE